MFGEILWGLKFWWTLAQDTSGKGAGRATVHLQGGILGGKGGLWESHGGARPTAQANSRKAAEMDHWEKGHSPAPGCSVAR